MSDTKKKRVTNQVRGWANRFMQVIGKAPAPTTAVPATAVPATAVPAASASAPAIATSPPPTQQPAPAPAPPRRHPLAVPVRPAAATPVKPTKPTKPVPPARPGPEPTFYYKEYDVMDLGDDAPDDTGPAVAVQPSAYTDSLSGDAGGGAAGNQPAIYGEGLMEGGPDATSGAYPIGYTSEDVARAGPIGAASARGDLAGGEPYEPPGNLSDKEVASYAGAAKLGEEVNKFVAQAQAQARKTANVAVATFQATVSAALAQIDDRAVALKPGDPSQADLDKASLFLMAALAYPGGAASNVPTFADAQVLSLVDTVGKAYATMHREMHQSTPDPGPLRQRVNALDDALPRMKQFKAASLLALVSGQAVPVAAMAANGTTGGARPAEMPWNEEEEQANHAAALAAETTAAERDARFGTPEQSKAADREAFTHSIEQADLGKLRSLLESADNYHAEFGSYYPDAGKAIGLDAWIKQAEARISARIAELEAAGKAEAAPSLPDPGPYDPQVGAEFLSARRKEVASLLEKVKAAANRPASQKAMNAMNLVTALERGRLKILEHAGTFEKSGGERAVILAEIKDGLRQGLLIERKLSTVLTADLASPDRGTVRAAQDTLARLTDLSGLARAVIFSDEPPSHVEAMIHAARAAMQHLLLDGRRADTRFEQAVDPGGLRATSQALNSLAEYSRCEDTKEKVLKEWNDLTQDGHTLAPARQSELLTLMNGPDTSPDVSLERKRIALCDIAQGALSHLCTAEAVRIGAEDLG